MERIRNAIGTIGTPLLVLVLVFSLVAPVAAAVSIGDTITITSDSTDTHNWQSVEGTVIDGTTNFNDGSLYAIEGQVETVELAADNGDIVDSVEINWVLHNIGTGGDYADPQIVVRDATSNDEIVTTVLAGDFAGGVETIDVSSLDTDTVTLYFDSSYSATDASYGQLRLTSATITTVAGNTAPVADAGADQSVLSGDTVSFAGSNSSDADGDALTYSWDFDGDGVEDATGATPTYTYATSGTYTVELTVSDGTDTATDSLTVTVMQPPLTSPSPILNSPPVIDSGLDPATNISATVNESVTFDVSNSSDADGDALTYSWDFDGDGVEDSANATAEYSYDTVGEYTATLTVSDGTDSVTESYTVVVEEAGEEPVGGGSADDGISTEAILALLGTFVFAVTVGVAVRRIA